MDHCRSSDRPACRDLPAAQLQGRDAGARTRASAERGGAADADTRGRCRPLTRTAILDRILSTGAKETEFVAREILKLGDLTVENTAFRALWQDRPIPLMPNEFRLLRYFVEHPGRVFSRAQLLQDSGRIVQDVVAVDDRRSRARVVSNRAEIGELAGGPEVIRPDRAALCGIARRDPHRIPDQEGMAMVGKVRDRHRAFHVMAHEELHHLPVVLLDVDEAPRHDTAAVGDVVLHLGEVARVVAASNPLLREDRTRRVRHRAGWDHPWLDDLPNVPPAKAIQMSALAFCLTLQGPALRSRLGPCVNPLLSQPVMEAGLAMSTVDLTWGGRDRAAARAAFAAVLPPSILDRRSKGELGAYYGGAVAAHLAFLRDYLLGGALAEAGLVDPGLGDAPPPDAELWAGRRLPSRHNTSAPDFVFRDFRFGEPRQ